MPVADGEGWETLLLARKRTGLGLARLIAEARAGALRLGRLGDAPGFHGLVVPIEEVENLAPRLATTDEEAILATGMSVKVHYAGGAAR